MTRPLSRRRALSLLAAAAGCAGMAGLVGSSDRVGKSAVQTVRWQGWALGAAAEITLRGPDRQILARALDAAIAELRRQEAIFSLFQRDSALVRLNRHAVLSDPPLELVTVLSLALKIARLSGGAFDPTVQPLWQVHAAAAQRQTMASAQAIEAARALVNWRAVEVSSQRITLGEPGMAVTLNGIAQGAVTDAVAGVLAQHGLTELLLDLGEMRASGGPWRVRLPHMRVGTADGDGESVFAFAERDAQGSAGEVALATSSTMGTSLLAAQGVYHLFDPATGRSVGGREAKARIVSVSAPSAAVADGLSTALAVLPDARAEPVLAAVGGRRAWIRQGDEEVRVIGT